MRVSQRLDYSVRLLVALARQPEGAFAGSGELADRLGLPRRFLELQVSTLKSAGLVRTRRGAGGGCALARASVDITVADVVRAVEGSVLDVPKTRTSATAEAWSRASTTLEEELASISLAELAARQAALDAEIAPIYDI
jgi:Rrf2 family protein